VSSISNECNCFSADDDNDDDVVVEYLIREGKKKGAALFPFSFCVRARMEKLFQAMINEFDEDGNGTIEFPEVRESRK